MNPANHQVLEGEALIGNSSEPYEKHNTMVLSSSSTESGVKITSAPDSSFTRGVLIAGEPLDQEIYQHGPFVVTNRQEAIQAIKDYQNGKNGFEGAPGWKSQIARNI